MNSQTKALVDACLMLRSRLKVWCEHYKPMSEYDPEALRKSAEALDAVLGTPCEQIRQSQ